MAWSCRPSARGRHGARRGCPSPAPTAAIRRAAIDRIKSHIPLAARLNAVVILGLIRGITPRGQSHEQSMAYLVEALQECSAAAAQAGVRYALEPLNRYETDLIHTVADGLALIEQVGAANFGLLLDTFHMNIEEPSIEESIRQAGSRIFHFHVADSNRWHPGAGHLDFASILRALFGTGYAGFVVGRVPAHPGCRDRRAARDRASQRSQGRLNRRGVSRDAPTR